MSAEIHSIVEKVKPSLVDTADTVDFVLAEGDSVPASIVIDNPNISLYCIDDVNKRAIFVEMPPEVELSEAAFCYMTQYEQARRVITMPYETLHQVASDLDADGSNIILIHNIARCGSTVISQALNDVDGMVSLAEPDVYTQLAIMCHLVPSRDAEHMQLLDSCTRVMRKYSPRFAVKFRIGSIHMCDLLHRAFPEAKNLFLYRHAETWAQSVHATIMPLVDSGPPTPQVLLFLSSITPLAPAFVAIHQREPTDAEGSALTWLSGIEAYLAFREQGIPLLALRFEDVRTHPKEVLAAIFEYCGLPLERVDAAYRAFSRDSQEGTLLSQANRQKHKVEPLTEAYFAEMRAVLREHPVIQSPDYIAPGTVTFEA